MIYFFGDTHGCFDHVLDVVGQDRPAAVVFLGDLQAQRPLEIELAPIIGMLYGLFVEFDDGATAATPGKGRVKALPDADKDL